MDGLEATNQALTMLMRLEVKPFSADVEDAVAWLVLPKCFFFFFKLMFSL